MKNIGAFNNANLQASKENLAKSVYLTIEEIIYNKSKIYDELFSTSISKLDVNLEVNPQVELNFFKSTCI